MYGQYSISAAVYFHPMSSVGKNIPHDSAVGHVSGESIYIDDMAPLRGELIVDFVWSPVAHGRIRSLDFGAARRPGVVALFTYRDLHHNLFGPIIQDELLLAEDVVIVHRPADRRHRGGIARGRSARPRRPSSSTSRSWSRSSRSMRRSGAELFIGKTMTIERGDVDAAFATREAHPRRAFINGGQDHFYLESQAALARARASTISSPSTRRRRILPRCRTSSRTSSGCRSTRSSSSPSAWAAASAARSARPRIRPRSRRSSRRRSKRPARIAYNKDDDMCVTGGRHPFQNDYKVGFDDDGVITAAQIDFFSDGGAFADLSTSVLGRAHDARRQRLLPAERRDHAARSAARTIRPTPPSAASADRRASPTIENITRRDRGAA